VVRLAMAPLAVVVLFSAIENANDFRAFNFFTTFAVTEAPDKNGWPTLIWPVAADRKNLVDGEVFFPVRFP
jgi:hypothetical protein